VSPLTTYQQTQAFDGWYIFDLIAMISRPNWQNILTAWKFQESRLLHLLELQSPQEILLAIHTQWQA